MDEIIPKVNQVSFQGLGPAVYGNSIGSITNHAHYNSNEKAQLKKKILVEYPDEFFTGRDDELHQLHTSLHRNNGKNEKTILSQTTIVFGLGGIGKTQLVRKYAQIYEHDHQHIIWINTEELHDSFQQVAMKLKITTSSEDTKSIAKNVYERLAEYNCLFIFDNADVDVKDFLPWNSHDNSYPIPYIIITTRNNAWIAIPVETVQLKELKVNEAIDFVKKGLATLDDDQIQDIKDLVELLQFYPLAVRQAIAYIQIEQRTKNSKFAIYDYSRLFREKGKAAKLLNFSFDGFTYEYTTITTLELSFMKIQSNNECGKTAMTILNIMAYLAPMSIQRESLKYLTSENEDGVQEIIDAVSLLVKYSIVTNEYGGSEVISVHRVVQEVMRIDLKQKRKEEDTLARTLKLLSDGFVESENTSHIAHVWKYASECKDLVVQHYDRDVSTYRYNTVDGYTTLHFLVRDMKYNEIEAIISILSETSETLLIRAMHATDKNENLPLHIAARDGHLTIAQLLIKKGTDVNMTNFFGQSPLHLAVARNNCMDMIKLLIKSGAEVNSIDKNGMPLVFIAFCHCPYDKSNITWSKSNGKWHIKTNSSNHIIDFEIVDVPILSAIDETDLATNLLKNLKMSHFEKANDLIQQIILAIDYGKPTKLIDSEPFEPLLERLLNTPQSGLMVDFLHDLENATKTINSIVKESDDNHFTKALQRLKKSDGFLTFKCTTKQSDMNVAKLDVVKYLIECGANLNDAIQNSKMCCLQWAAQNNETQIFKFFLENGANVNSLMNGNTPLVAAVHNENVEIVKLIVNHPRADVNLGERDTPLHLATFKNQLSIVEHLLKKGANINAVFDNQTPPMIANDLGFRDILKLFIDNGADPNNCSQFFESPLHNAAKEGDFEFAKYLIEKGANVNAQNIGKFTPLHYSVRFNFFDITELLFEKGADHTIPHFNGITPMQMAGRICNIKMLRLFGTTSPESYAKNESFKNLVRKWLIYDREDLQDYLNITMANVKSIKEYTNACDADGNTPLMWAIRNSSIVAAAVLLEYGADVDTKNYKKETALHWAVNSIQPEFVRLLIEANINLKCKDRNGKTPLAIALKMHTENPSDQKMEEIFGLLLSLQNNSTPNQCWLRELMFVLPLIVVLIYLFINLFL